MKSEMINSGMQSPNINALNQNENPKPMNRAIREDDEQQSNFGAITVDEDVQSNRPLAAGENEDESRVGAIEDSEIQNQNNPQRQTGGIIDITI